MPNQNRLKLSTKGVNILSWILETEIEELRGKLKRIKALVIECEADNKVIQSEQVLDIINER